ncbi:Phage terminase-like protein, large subunit, contains N-terminal HTH domain [Nakamurella panacisegetis]|uniref:Phage terminase-like protein, large subunit, contains N-terminal HTH domain n=1 Tax=Nakamurella panacisegetis TaxID=1090615 RepID=A0A1H0PY91_9ACTN|nr:terminase large subunit [Nakamurella panacisegetis]SDP09695.1 Phage terminase-like protein, large subunit, contains N-terminal HTH domain [Nakamurella panacisegetis]
MTNAAPLVLPGPDPSWAPALWTPSRSRWTDGDDVVDFSAALLKASRGFRAGEPLRMAAWQAWLLRSLMERDPLTGLLRFRRALIGLPRKNGKSLLGTALALQHLIFGPQGAQVYSAAGDRAQARIVFSEARQQVIDSPALSRLVKVYRDVLEVPSRGAIYRALSADAMRAHGLGPSLVVADELHGWPSSPSNHRGDELWEALVSGSGDRPESLVVGITTAGSNTDTLLGRLVEHGRRVAAGEIDDPSFGMWWWGVPDDADPTDPRNWARANPNLAEGLLDPADFRSAIASAGTAGFAGFQRFRLNQWIRTFGDDFISAPKWAAQLRLSGVVMGERVTAGFDGSVSGDATGIVVQSIETGVLAVHKLWEPDPDDPEWTVDRDEVNASIEELFAEYDVEMLWADPSFYESDVLEWSRAHRRRVLRIPPTNQRVIPLAQQFLTDLVSGTIGHNEPNGGALTRHVLNAVATEAGSFKKEKKHSPRKIDLLFCAVMANGARNAVLAKPRKKRSGGMLL